MPPQGTKDNHCPEKASMLKKRFDDNDSSSDMLDKCILNQAKCTKIFSTLHLVNLSLTLGLLGCSVYFFRDINQQLHPVELEAERQISSTEEESGRCCENIAALMVAKQKLEERIAAVENHLHDVKRMVMDQRDISEASEVAPEPVVGPHGNIGVQRGIVMFEEPKTDIELPVQEEGSGESIDYIFVDEYDDDPQNDHVEVLNPGEEIEGSGNPGHHHHHHHHHEPTRPKCIPLIRPVCPNDCYDEVQNDAGCMIPVCCH